MSTLPSHGWYKSSRSDTQNACVEVNLGTGAGMGVRDTKDHGQGPVLHFAETSWTSFIEHVKASKNS